MKLSPSLYDCIIRPKCFVKLFIYNVLNSFFNFEDKTVLDFGSGTGINSIICNPETYLGVDVDSKRVFYARQLYPNYNFKVLEGNSFPVPNGCIDYIFIVAVLHHISNKDLVPYLNEFQRILKPQGFILIIEPCIQKGKSLNNWFMQTFDNGKFIREEEDYLDIFHRFSYSTNVRKRFRKLLYNEIFFTASPVD